MRFGCRCAIEEMAELANAGFEFAEMSPSALYPTLGDDAFRRARRDLLAEPLFPEVIRIPELLAWAGADTAELRQPFRRAALVGCQIIIAEMPGFDTPPAFGRPTRAWRAATTAVSVLGEYAARVGVRLALEPRPGSIEEAWVLAEEAGHAAVGVSLDLAGVDDLADIAAAEALLTHVSMPAPRNLGGELDSARCMDALEHLVEFRYAGRMTITTPWRDISKTADDLLDELKRLASAEGV